MTRDGPTNEIEIHPGVAADLPGLNDIYNHYVIETATTFDVTPISREERKAWFRDFGRRGPHRLFVATGADGPIGFASSKDLRAKEAYSTTVEVTVYLAPGASGRGTGTRLYSALFDALAEEEVHRAYAGITIPNQASIALHEKLGFCKIGIYHEVGRKFGRYWSVQWYELRLDERGRR